MSDVRLCFRACLVAPILKPPAKLPIFQNLVISKCTGRNQTLNQTLGNEKKVMSYTNRCLILFIIMPSHASSQTLIFFTVSLQALTNVWWQNIGKNIRCSETKFGQLFCTKHGRIIAHVFTIVLHKTQNHNRANVLCTNLYTVFGSCFYTKQ